MTMCEQSAEGILLLSRLVMGVSADSEMHLPKLLTNLKMRLQVMKEMQETVLSIVPTVTGPSARIVLSQRTKVYLTSIAHLELAAVPHLTLE